MGLIPKIIVIGLCSLTDLPVSSLGMAIYFLVSDPNFMEDQNCHNDFDYIAFYYASSRLVVSDWFFVKAEFRSSTLFAFDLGLLSPKFQQ